MRWLVCLAEIAIAVAGAILGSLAFSAHQQPMPVATAEPAWNRGSVSTRLTDQPCDFEELATSWKTKAFRLPRSTSSRPESPAASAAGS